MGCRICGRWFEWVQRLDVKRELSEHREAEEGRRGSGTVSLAMAWVAGGVVVGRVGKVVQVAVSAAGVAEVDAALGACGVGEVGARSTRSAAVIVSVGYDAGRGFEAAAVAGRSPVAGARVADSDGCAVEQSASLGGAPDDRGWPGLVCVVLEEWRLVSVEEACEMLRRGSTRFCVGEILALRDDVARRRFEAGVARVLEYIRAGDVYQVNLAHRLSASFEGDPRALMAALVRAGMPRQGAYVEFTDDAGRSRVIASASPELFLEYEPASHRGGVGTLRTRPMKGTRGTGSASESAVARELAGSVKDRAELAMIVDLMRNDLGRVCELGSVRVESAHSIEKHGEGGAGLLQATATVAGAPRAGLRWSEVLAAMFPGGSVTGAPKIRAMQIIDEIEEARRGPYCGSVGVFLPGGEATLNIAIRTACIAGERDHAGMMRGGTLDWWVGAGIVADSTPEGEWAETLAKAAVLRAAIGSVT